MNTTRRDLLGLAMAGVATAGLTATGAARAQALPQNAQITMLVPFAPGGPVDYVARLMARRLGARTGNTVIVDNKPGANGTIAANALLQARPDGQTLMVTGQGLMTITAHLSTLPFDPLKDLTVVSGLAYSDTALVVGKAVPANNMKEFVELARRTQPPLAMGSGGRGNVTHLYIERLKDVAKVDFLHVPYKGVAPAIQEVMGGQIAGVFAGLVAALPLMKAGQLKALGVIGDARSPLAPDVPTMAEQGYAINDAAWFALIAPPRMRTETSQALAAVVAEVLREDETRADLAKAGLNPWGKTPSELARLMREESGRWGKLIHDNKITE